jgi:hypothetical protein
LQLATTTLQPVLIDIHIIQYKCDVCGEKVLQNQKSEHIHCKEVSKKKRNNPSTGVMGLSSALLL